MNDDLVAPSATLEMAWTEQGKWSRAASAAKKSYVRWSGHAVWMSIAAAAAGTAATELPWEWARRLLTFAAGVLIALLAVVARYKTSPEKLRGWIRARSVSEGLKSEVYTFVTRTGMYRDGEPHETLSKRVDEIIKSVEDLRGMVAGEKPTTDRFPEDPMPVGKYLSDRVLPQIENYYEPNAATERALVTKYGSAEFLLATGGAVLAAGAAVANVPALAAWGAVITTAIAALAAHLAMGRHEYQSTTYTATGLRLRQLKSKFEDAHAKREATPAEINALVTECEAVISAENQGWMAQWQKQQRAATPPQQG